MSLGLARDSIVDLQSLVQNVEDESNNERLLLPSKLSNQQQPFDTCEEEFHFIADNEEKVEELHLPSQPSNDYTNTVPTNSIPKQPPPPSIPSSRKKPVVTDETNEVVQSFPSIHSGVLSSNYDDFNYYHDPYAPSMYHPDSHDDDKFCCLFPWTSSTKSFDEDSVSTSSTCTSPEAQEDDDDKTIQQKKDEEQEVANRHFQETNRNVPLPKHEASTLSGSTSQANENKETKLKGILKYSKSNAKTKMAFNNGHLNQSSNNNGDKNSRRNLFPSYGPALSMDEEDHVNKSTKSVQFSPMARVMPITPRHMMSFVTRSSIWWQRSDYDEFKRAGRMISKAILQGGSEIWLQTSNAWDRKRTPSSEDKEEDTADVGEKWWCKFGHSRRGLEHIVTIEEGRTRQQYVNNAIRAVLEEQRRQRITMKDPERLASVAARHTAWARDLALAAGAADEEAVQSNFNTNARSRVEHLRRNLKGKQSSNDGRVSANFIISTNQLSDEILDAHTETSLRLKQQAALGKAAKTLNEEKESIEHSISKAAAGFHFEGP